MKEKIYDSFSEEYNKDDMGPEDYERLIDEWEESTYGNARVYEPDFGEEEDEDMEF